MTRRLAPLPLALAALAALAVGAPGAAPALVRETRTGPISGTPLVVTPSPFAQAWIDAAPSLDLAPLSMTLSDGARWTRSPGAPRWDFSAGAGAGRFAAALEVGLGTAALAAQVDALRREERRLGITGTARIVYGGGWDLSLVPAYGWHAASGRWGTLVPFVAARVRWGRTLYDVSGWNSDRASPFATAITRDLALAPMAGVAASWRFAEVRATAGWELLLVDRVAWEDRPTALRRSGGAFALLLLRARIGGSEP